MILHLQYNLPRVILAKKEKLLYREIIKLNDEKSAIEVVHGRAEDIDLPHQGWKSQR
jgi:hypothetical protein